MKKMFLLTAALLLSAGCTVTKSVVTEYGSDGKVVKITESRESVVRELTNSTKEKTVVCWESGWAAGISGTTATASDPTPTVKMFAGKTDKGLISALKDQQNWEGIASVIHATKYDLSVSAEGVSSAAK